MNIRNSVFAIMASLGLYACGPVGPGAETRAGETGEDEVGETGEDGCAPYFVKTDEDGWSWARSSGWEEWGQYADPSAISDAIAAGLLFPTQDDLLVPADADCFDTSGDAHVCVATVDCVPLLARPVGELILGPRGCAALDPWQTTAEGLDECWGILGDIDGAGVAVLLEP